MDEPRSDPMFTALYAALAAIDQGTIAEAEVESRTVLGDDQETVLTVTVRREIRTFTLTEGD